MSILLKPAIPLRDAPMLTLACGTAAAEAIEGAANLRVMLKWPNDLFTQSGKKLGGILVESHAEGGRLLYAFEPEDIITRWSARSYLTGRHVRVDDAGRVTEGTAVGLDVRGRLIVRRPDGTEAHVVAGDVG